MNRRNFTKALTLAPLGLTLRTAVFGQQAASSPAKPAAPVQQIPKSAPYAGKRPPIHETEPFAEPVVFQRQEAKSRVKPFALREVQLDTGPFQQARDWNRGYMLRLGNDRLLHNFRVTAGLPSNAEPLLAEADEYW